MTLRTKLFALARPAIFALDSETGHKMAIAALKALPSGAPRAQRSGSSPLAVSVAGLDFPNPVGVAAGFDKDAEVPDPLLGLGFGFTEVGSITPLPQAGNPKPRLFRLTPEDAGLDSEVLLMRLQLCFQRQVMKGKIRSSLSST